MPRGRKKKSATLPPEVASESIPQDSVQESVTPATEVASESKVAEMATLQRFLADYLAQEVVPMMLRQIEQRDAESRATLGALIPTRDDVIAGVVAALQPKLDSDLAIIGTKLNSQLMAALPAASEKPNAASPAADMVPAKDAQSNGKVAAVGAMVDTLLDSVIDKLMPVVKDFREEARKDRIETRQDWLYAQNPFFLAAQMREGNSPLFPYYAAAFAPPTQAQIDAQQHMLNTGMTTGLQTRIETILKAASQWPVTRSAASPNPSGVPSAVPGAASVIPSTGGTALKPMSNGVKMQSSEQGTRSRLQDGAGSRPESGQAQGLSLSDVLG